MSQNVIIFSADRASEMVKLTSGKSNHALGYLIGWGGDFYSHCNVTMMRDGEIQAWHHKNESDTGFLLVAIWRADESSYSYHS